MVCLLVMFFEFGITSVHHGVYEIAFWSQVHIIVLSRIQGFAREAHIHNVSPHLEPQVQGYPATDIEERMYIALLRSGVSDADIEFQPSYIAGRNMSGEIRPDFADYSGALIRIWYADADYWHRSAAQRNKDRTNDAILFQRLNGKIEFPYRVPGRDLETQEDADRAIANPSKYQDN